ncbi:transglycosylase family protein [Svornostia abyssi]|uniref:Transglycosylase family protein n=1 Tax=Svornostia abyssi TaxID=2898438 RepID=A0ABY5PP17_9ACTN|nr:transglycosylase family protein [Parviterribacteraceae bacterium J379]
MPDRAAPRALIIEKSRERARRGAVVVIGVVALLLGGALAGLVADGDAGSTATAAAAPTGEDLIRSAQRRLGVPADGVVGPATRAAIKAFQDGRGLPVTGRLDDATLVALGIVREQLSVLSTTVASGAVASDPALAERASVPPETTTAPAETTPATTETTATAPAATTTTPTTPTTPEEPPVDEEAERDAPPVVGGALAGAPPPAVGGQVHGEGGLVPGPATRRDAAAAREGPPQGDPRDGRPVAHTAQGGGRPDRTGDACAPGAHRALRVGGNPRAISANGMYRGKYQFSRATWRTVGGKGDPAAASEAEQDRRAAILYRRSGPAPWPVCGRA